LPKNIEGEREKKKREGKEGKEDVNNVLGVIGGLGNRTVKVGDGVEWKYPDLRRERMGEKEGDPRMSGDPLGEVGCSLYPKSGRKAWVSKNITPQSIFCIFAAKEGTA